MYACIMSNGLLLQGDHLLLASRTWPSSNGPKYVVHWDWLGVPNINISSLPMLFCLFRKQE
jgi:hypothetical protein